jgi:hypothetical protein
VSWIRILLLVAAFACTAALPLPTLAARTTAPTAAAAALPPSNQLARGFGGFGRSYGSRSYGSRYSYGRRYPYGRGYGYRPRGHGFLHGLFWGWMLSHFFRGGYGVPLWPFFLVIVLLLVSRRRRRYYGAY